MSQLIVRNIESAVVKQLKLRAARNGRSAEEEHRELLRAALLKPSKNTFHDHLFSIPTEGNDVDFDIRRDLARRVRL